MTRQSLNFAFGLVGVFGTIFGVWAYFNTLQTKEISFESYSRPVYLGSAWFETKAVYNGVEISNGATISETAFVIWNSGSATIAAADVRKSLTFSTTNGPGFFSTKLSETKSIVPNNFSLDVVPDQNGSLTAARLEFKTLDPGMAARVLLLHNGLGSVISVDGNFGPGFILVDHQSSRARRGVLFVMFAATLLAIAAAFVGYFSATWRQKSLVQLGVPLLIAVGSALLLIFEVFPYVVSPTRPLGFGIPFATGSAPPPS